MTLNFHSDRALAGRGFYLHYKVDKVPGVGELKLIDVTGSYVQKDVTLVA